MTSRTQHAGLRLAASVPAEPADPGQPGDAPGGDATTRTGAHARDAHRLDAALAARAEADFQWGTTTDIPLEALYARYAPYVAAIAMRILGRESEVEDLVQDVFATAVRGLRRRRNHAEIKRWLATVTVRRSIHRLRLLALWSWIDLDEEPHWERIADPDLGPDERRLVAQVYRALERMPIRDRVAWVLRHVEGENLQRVAELCGCSLATAKRRIARAHGRIGAVIEGERAVDLEQRLRAGPLRVRDVWSADKTAELASKVVRLRRRRSLARAGIASCAGLCAVAALLFARDALRSPASEHGALARLPSSGAQVRAGETALVLRDGSRAEPADAESRLSVVRDRADHVSVRLQRGSARFAVVRNPKRRFEVESGPVLVQVVGTTFTVTRTAEGARVAVEDGRVHVHFAGEQTVLTAGETGVFPPPFEALDARAASVASEPTEVAAAGGGAGWRDLARRGEYRKAYSALHRAPTRVRDLPEDHMLAADVARLSGHPAQAVPHLRRVADRFANDPRAPVAAFTLGRVLVELHRPREAAASFRRARTLWPRGPLVLDAWASEAESLNAAGDAGAAVDLAERYLARHPEGRHAPAMRALAGSD